MISKFRMVLSKKDGTLRLQRTNQPAGARASGGRQRPCCRVWVDRIDAGCAQIIVQKARLFESSCGMETLRLQQCRRAQQRSASADGVGDHDPAQDRSCGFQAAPRARAYRYELVRRARAGTRTASSPPTSRTAAHLREIWVAYEVWALANGVAKGLAGAVREATGRRGEGAVSPWRRGLDGGGRSNPTFLPCHATLVTLWRAARDSACTTAAPDCRNTAAMPDDKLPEPVTHTFFAPIQQHPIPDPIPVVEYKGKLPTEEENRIEMAVDELISYIREEKYDEARAMLEKEPTIVNGKTHVGFAA